jgi:hypothetical protein
MGFLYKKMDNRRYYYEQPRIIEQRHAYLRRIKQNKIEKRPVVYLDETWANANDGQEMAWVEKDTVTGGTVGGMRRPPGKGRGSSVLEREVRRVGSPIPHLSSALRRTQMTTMMR